MKSSDPLSLEETDRMRARVNQENHRPAGRLGQFVAELVAIRSPPGQPTFGVRRFPDGTLSLLFRLRQDGNADLSVSGARTLVLEKSVVPPPFVLQVRFKPGGAYPFFGGSTGELTNRMVGLEELWGREGSRLCEALAASRTDAERLDLVQGALLQRLECEALFEPGGAWMVRRAVSLVASSREFERVDVLAKAIGSSTRHLRRTFRQAVGIGPKEFARIVRFQRILGGLRRRLDSSELAAHAGYYDQAHMISEFREFAGTTPSVFLKQQQPATDS